MTEIKKKYKVFIKELEKTITDKEELKVVKEKFNELFIYFLDQFDKIIDNYDKKIEEVVAIQKMISTKTEILEKNVKEMQKDFYEEDDYDFEIICPYCNNNFVIDLNEETKNEIECPECNNIIELDWNEEDCDCGECHNCSCEEECDYEDDM